MTHKLIPILRSFHRKINTIVSSLVSIISVLIFSDYLCHFRLKNRFNKSLFTNDCIILGNGPSLSNYLPTHFNDINESDVFVVNFFYTSEYFDIIKPKSYVILDPGIFSSKPPEHISENVKGMISRFNEVSWRMNLFVPARYKKSKLLNSISNELVHIVTFNNTPVKGNQYLENILFRFNYGMPLPETVILATIFLAINHGYKYLNIHGVEQSWLKYLKVDDENRVSVALPHFDEDSGEISVKGTLSEFLYSQARVFQSHSRLEQYANYRGSKIVNYTPDSYIDAYERSKVNQSSTG